MHRFLSKVDSKYYIPLFRNVRRSFVFLRSPRAFTLIELLVVIAVLGVLAGGVFVAINPLKRIGQANDAKIKSDIGQIANAMQAYYVTNQKYPATLQELKDSGDLKTIPTKPDGGSYEIKDPEGCTSPCADIVVFAPLSAPQTTGGNWQWDSVTGQVGETTAPTPTVTPAPAVATNTPTPTPDPSLVGYWKMNETISPATDFSGRGNTGTWVGNAKNTTGRFGNAILLDGNGDYITKTNPSVPTGNSAITVSAWIYPTTYGDATYNGIVSWGPRGDCSNKGKNFLFSIKNDGRLSMATWCNDASQNTGTAATINTWNHAVITMSGTSVTFYLNGVQVDSTKTLSVAPNISSGTLNIGSTDNPGRYFTGRIDEVRIYNRALSASEITTLYNYTPSP